MAIVNCMEFYGGVKVRNLPPINAQDPRGLTYEVFKGEHMEQLTASKRYAGTKSGDHFHKGESPSRDPEINFILHGKGLFKIYDWRGDKRIDSEHEVDEGDVITIEKGVYHTLHALTDLIILERMVVPFDMNNSDIYRGLDTYQRYIDSLKS
jgi:dTDP-4-dehydrorhamnose 3,5-epimerase-like enzyme